MKKSDEEFKYVVARPWYDDEPDNLCIYTYHTEVQEGTIEDAKKFLEYVERKADKDEKGKYGIYKVTYEKIG